MSKKSTRYRKSDSHPPERHSSLHDPQTQNATSPNERKQLLARIAELERVVTAQQAAAAREVQSPRARPKTARKTKKVTLESALTVKMTKRLSFNLGKTGKGSRGLGSEDHLTARDLDLGAEFEEYDEYDSYEEYDESESYDYEDPSGSDYGLDTVSLGSAFEDASSVTSSSTLPLTIRDGDLDADTITQFKDNLDRNQVLLLPPMLDSHPDLLNHVFDGKTTLQLIIERRSIELLKLLLGYGLLDINQVYEGGFTVLHWILHQFDPLERFHVLALEAILALRPEYAYLQEDVEGHPPLWVAITRANHFAYLVYLANLRNESSLFAQTQLDLFLACIKILAERDPNATARSGISVLSYTVKLGFIAAFDLLLESGANTNIQDNKGDTPLHYVINAMTEMNFARAAAVGSAASSSSSAPLHASGSTSSLSTSSSGIAVSSSSIIAQVASPPVYATPTKGHSMELSRSRDIASAPISPRHSTPTPLRPERVSSTIPFSKESVISPPHSRRLDRSASQHVDDGGGIRLTTTIRHMCTRLLMGGANIYLANLQGMTPHAKSFLRPELQMIFENYNPGCKIWKHRMTDLQIGRKIGVGAFGEVFLARLHGTDFAVKMIELAEASKHEAGIMTDIRHPNILTFVGMYYPDDGNNDQIGIVTEYLQMGSLSQFLGFPKDEDAFPTTIAWPVMMRIALTVARGMAWLHSRDPAIIHHDLHAGNVLLATEAGDTKLCDFGLSNLHGRTPKHHYDRIRAPEEVLGPASDVYCFGFLLFQLLITEKATKPRIQELHNKFRPGVLGALLLPVLDDHTERLVKLRRPWHVPPPGLCLADPDPWPEGANICYVDILDLIVQCTMTDPKQRPTFESLVSRLEELSINKSLIKPVVRYVPLPDSLGDSTTISTRLVAGSSTTMATVAQNTGPSGYYHSEGL